MHQGNLTNGDHGTDGTDYSELEGMELRNADRGMSLGVLSSGQLRGGYKFAVGSEKTVRRTAEKIAWALDNGYEFVEVDK